MTRARLVVIAFAALCALSGCRRGAAPRDRDASPLPQAVSPARDSGVAVDAVDAVSGASRPYDAGAPARVTGTVDGASLRRWHRARIAADRSAVTVVQGGSAQDLGRRVCEASVPRRPLDLPGLLKPNIGGFDWFKAGEDDRLQRRITDPQFVRGVIHCLKARGHTRITVAEGWGATHADWNRLVKASGYEAMTTEEGVPLVAMDDDGVFDVKGDQPGKPLRVTGMEHTGVPSLLIPKILAEHLANGMFISLPKIKAHRFAVVSIGIKGTQGPVMLSDASPAFRQKWRMHRELGPVLEATKKGLPEDRAAYVRALEVFAERIADVLEINTPDVVLAEGAPAMGGDGFGKFVPSAETFAVGGTNVVLVDRVGAELLGLWDNDDLARELGGHATSPLIEAAAARFKVDLSHPLTQGDGKSLLDQPRRGDLEAMAPFSIHSPGARGRSERPEAHAVALGGAEIVIDGKGDDDAYARAPPVTWDTDFAGQKTATVTRVRFVWDKSALYTLIENQGAGLNVDAARPTHVEHPTLYEQDCNELMIAPDSRVPKRYLEVELGPLGHFLDVSVDRTGARTLRDLKWSSGVSVVATRDTAAGTSTIEARLAAPELARALVAGARLPMGLFRIEGKSPRTYLAWSPPRTARPDFHRPDAFGTLLIDAPQTSQIAPR